METTHIPANAERPLEELEVEIGQLSAHLAAVTCAWLLLIAEFERREGHYAHGARSCAEWLSWRCGLSLITARQQLQVARRLEELPLVRAAFAAGELSYSKARALCRIATPATEADLVDVARHATASHVDRIARARRSVARLVEREEQGPGHDRSVDWFFDDDGALVLSARLDAEEGALVIQALESARHALRDAAAEGGGDSAESRPSVDTHAGRPSNADALVLLADTMLAHGPAERDGGDRYQVVIVADAAVLAGASDEGTCQVEGGPALDPEAARMAACDARILALLRGEDDEVLSVGRATRSIPRHIRRALRFRDKGCTFPGCSQTRWVDGHHIVHWADGGETSLSNLCLLCRYHHGLVHRQGFGLYRDPATGQLVFTAPAGDVLPGAPAPEGPVDLDPETVNRRLGVVMDSATGACLWDGQRMDLDMVIWALLSQEQRN